MKRNWKRILSLWLTVCMVFTMNFGLGATAVYAEAGVMDATSELVASIEADDDGATKLEDVFKLKVNGDDGETQPTSVTATEEDYSTGEWSYTGKDKDDNNVTGETLLANLKPATTYTATINVTKKGSHAGVKVDGGQLSTSVDVSETYTTADLWTASLAVRSNESDTQDSTSTKTLLDIFEGAVKDSKEDPVAGANNWVIKANTWSVKNGDNVVVTGNDGSKKISEIYNALALTEDTNYTLTVTAEFDTDSNHADPDPNWADGGKGSATLTINGPEAVAAGNDWGVTVGGKAPSKANVTSIVKDGDVTTITFADKQFADGEDVIIAPKKQNPGKLVITGGSTTDIDTNTTITVGNKDFANAIYEVSTGVTGTYKIVPADDVSMIKKHNDKYELLASGETAASTDTDYLFAVAKEINPASDYVTVNGRGFKLQDGYVMLDDSTTPNFVEPKTGTITLTNDGKTTYANSNAAEAYAINPTKNNSNDGLIKFVLKDVVATGAGVPYTLINALDEAALKTNGTIPTTNSTVSLNIADGAITDGNKYVATLTSAKGAISKEVEKKTGKALEIIFDEEDGVLPNTTYNKAYISYNGAIAENIVTLGCGKEISLTGVKTKNGQVTASDLNVRAFATSINIAPKITKDYANGAIVALVVSANSKTEADKLVKGTFADTLTNYTAINGTGTEWKTSAEKQAYKTDGNKTDIAQNTTYQVYAAYASGSALDSEVSYIGSFTTVKIEEITPALTVKNFEYLGANQSISANITAKSSTTTPKTGNIVIKAIPKDTYITLASTKNEAGIFADAAAVLITKGQYTGSNKGWPADDYVALAQFEPDAGDDTYATGDTVSKNFTINKAVVYAVPELGFTSISMNEALGSRFPGKFNSVIYDANNKPVAGLISTGAHYYANDKEITATTSFNTAGKVKIYASSNGITSTVVDQGSYDVKNKVKYVELDVVNPGDITLARSDRTLYYQNYVKMKTMEADARKDEIKTYLTATMGGADITDLSEITYIYRDENNELIYSETFPQNLKATDYLYVSANYAYNGGSSKESSVAPLGILINKQPVQVVGSEMITSKRLSDVIGYYALDKGVKVYPVYFDANNKAAVSKNELLTDFDTVQKVSTLSGQLDISVIDNSEANTYSDILMTFDSASMNSTFSTNYEVYEADTVKNGASYLEKYQVEGAYKVDFYSGMDGSVLANSQIVDAGTTLISVSINDASLSANTWSIKYSTAADVSEIDAASINNLNNDYIHYELTVNAIYDDVSIYASHIQSSGSSAGTIEVEPIPSVIYTGTKHVSKLSEMNGTSNDLDIVVNEVYSDGKTALKEGEDYTLSYKNNINVGYAGTKNGPKVIIKGKGDYKSLKLEVPFAIVPMGLDNAEMTLKDGYVKVGKDGKANVNVTIKLDNGKKVGKNLYSVYLYDSATNAYLGENNTKSSALVSLMSDGTTHTVKVLARAKAGVKNQIFAEGSTKWDTVVLYPHDAKKLNVKVKPNFIEYSSSKKTMTASDFANNLEASYKKANYTKDQLDLTLYSDKGLTESVTTAKNTGDYYLTVLLKDSVADKKTNVLYMPASVKVSFKGKGLKGSAAPKLKDTSKIFTYNGKSHTIYVDVSTATTDNTKVTVFNKAGNEIEDVDVKSKDSKKTWEIEFGSDNAKFNNLAVGNYKIEVKGQKEYSGKVTLKYKVAKASLGTLKLKSDNITINGGKAVPYNAGGISTTVVVKDSQGKTLSVDSVEFTAAKAGSNAGTAKISIFGYSGSVSKKFDVAQIRLESYLDVGDNKYGDINIVAGSTVSGAKTPNVYVMQYGTKGYAQFKLGTDYTLDNVAYNEKQSTGTVVVTPGTKNSSRLTGSSRTVTFDTYPTSVKKLQVSLSDNAGYDSSKKAYVISANDAIGKAVKPTPIVTATVDKTTVTLVEGTDYTVSYYNNTGITTTKAPAICQINILNGKKYPNYPAPYATFQIVKDYSGSK